MHDAPTSSRRTRLGRVRASSLDPCLIHMHFFRMGFSLLVVCWAFYRVSGALFNPAVSFSLVLASAITPMRGLVLTVAQIVGGIIGAALVDGSTSGGVSMVETRLRPGLEIGQGVSGESCRESRLELTFPLYRSSSWRCFLLRCSVSWCSCLVCNSFLSLRSFRAHPRLLTAAEKHRATYLACSAVVRGRIHHFK